jgi:hypothetical protein
MSEIYGYANAVSSGNSADELLGNIRRQIDAQNSLARDNFSKLRQNEKDNTLVAKGNLQKTKIKDRESEGLESAAVMKTLNELSKRRGDLKKLGNKVKGFSEQASKISESLRPTADIVKDTLARDGGVPRGAQGLDSLLFGVGGAGRSPAGILSRDARSSDLPSLDFFNSSPDNLPDLPIGSGATNIINRGENTGFELVSRGEPGISTGGLPLITPARFRSLTGAETSVREATTGVNVSGDLDDEVAEGAENLSIPATRSGISRFLGGDFADNTPAGFFKNRVEFNQPKENDILAPETEGTTNVSDAPDILAGLTRARAPAIIDAAPSLIRPVAPSLIRPVAPSLIRPVAPIEQAGASAAPSAIESLRESLKAGSSAPAPTFASRQIASSVLPEGSEASILGAGAEVAEGTGEKVAEKAGGVSAGEIVGGALKGATILTGGYDLVKDIGSKGYFSNLGGKGFTADKVANVAGVITGGLETAGLVADATGIGAVVGVPLQALGLISGVVGLASGIIGDVDDEKKKTQAVGKLPSISASAKAPQAIRPAFESAFQGGTLVQ